jgi:predicted RND superfamily exporter protein
MAAPFHKIRLPASRIFIQVALVLGTALLIGLTLGTVRLTPQIDASVFFGDDDSQLTEDRKIYKIFPQQEQIIINIEGKISSPAYLDKINKLTQKLLKIPEVVSAKSLTHGPKDFEDAIKSELWRRILIPDDRKSSNIFVVLDAASLQQAILKIEATVEGSKQEEFKPVIAGIPYMIELIRRRLLDDLKVFSLGAVGIFGLMILYIFRSFSVFAGFLTASAAAASLTLLLTWYFGIGIGILTANLITLVFVLTIPHLIYFTYNWRGRFFNPSSRDQCVQEAFWETLNGSLWSTGTTLLGFLSLLLVQAKPLRQLGASGSIGTISALFAAYIVYPPFLLGIKPHQAAQDIEAGIKNGRRTDAFDGAKPDLLRRGRKAPLGVNLSKYSRWIAGGFVAACLLLGAGILRLNTDPSLLSYFPEKLRRSLEHVDRTGGSGLMEIVLRDSRGRKLDHNEAYEDLWQLQRSLEQDPDIGTVISLPMVMAEGGRSPFSILLSWKTILKKMDEPRYERIARSSYPTTTFTATSFCG